MPSTYESRPAATENVDPLTAYTGSAEVGVLEAHRRAPGSGRRLELSVRAVADPTVSLQF